MSRSKQCPDIKIWSYSQTPAWLRKIAPASCEWIALIARELVCPEIETLFERWHSEARPVSRYVLDDGSVLMGGDSRLFVGDR